MPYSLHNIHSNAQVRLAICKVGLSARRGGGAVYTTVRRLANAAFAALCSWALRHPQATLRLVCTTVAVVAFRLAYIAVVLHDDGPFGFICLLVAVLVVIVAYGGVSIRPDDLDTPAPHYRGTDFARDERARTLAAQQRGQVLLRRR